jgi:hypothetical protein
MSHVTGPLWKTVGNHLLILKTGKQNEGISFSPHFLYGLYLRLAK